MTRRIPTGPPEPGSPLPGDKSSAAAAATSSSIEGSPNPDVEWNIASILGDQLASLVGISISSMHRYRSGERRTPDDVAARLHVIALIVADLAGSYNDYGIRRWFERSRTALGGLTPSEVMSGDWDPSSMASQTVRGLADELTT